jgi:cytochrome c-type biogenesis protein CcmH/NrfF
MSLPVAHAGHWLAGLLYAAPVVVLGAAVAISSWRERRRERAERSERRPRG